MKQFFKIIIFVLILVGVLALAGVRVFAENQTVSVRLDIESATSTIFNDVINVSACEPSASSTPTINAYCAILQTGLESDWSSWGDDKFLNSVNSIANDFGNNLYWLWFFNLEYGQTALNKHTLSPDENLLITLGRMPLKLEISTTSPVVGNSFSASVSQFGFDSSYNGVWTPAASSSIKIGDELFPTDENGHYDIAVSSSEPFSISAVKSGFLNSAAIMITPVISATTTATSTPPAETPSPPTALVGFSSGGSGRETIIEHHNIDVNKAFQFLTNNQKENGSFGASLYTDWAAIALASGPQSFNKGKIISYLKSLDGGDLISATDYERRAMALMSLGISPYNGASINYIQKIVDKFDGNQIGNTGLVNDDIFAIFPLVKSGYSSEDGIIQKTVSFILSKQNSDGSWAGGVDMTSAAVQALSLVSGIDDENQAKEKARGYLLAHQNSDGGFGSSFSTSWALQAITALGELDSTSSPQAGSDWIKNEKNPYDYLYSLQQDDGGIENISADIYTRIWATVYAIPATLNKPWGAILSSFDKPVQQTQGNPADSVPVSAGKTSSSEPNSNSSSSQVLAIFTPTSSLISAATSAAASAGTLVATPATISATTSSVISFIPSNKNDNSNSAESRPELKSDNQNSRQLASIESNMSGKYKIIGIIIGGFLLAGLVASFFIL